MIEVHEIDLEAMINHEVEEEPVDRKLELTTRRDVLEKQALYNERNKAKGLDLCWDPAIADQYPNLAEKFPPALISDFIAVGVPMQWIACVVYALEGRCDYENLSNECVSDEDCSQHHYKLYPRNGISVRFIAELLDVHSQYFDPWEDDWLILPEEYKEPIADIIASYCDGVREYLWNKIETKWMKK